jgi:hypothetical protein
MKAAPPALAADTDANLQNGAVLFTANCAGCNAGGRNLVADKKLTEGRLGKVPELECRPAAKVYPNGHAPQVSAFEIFGPRLQGCDELRRTLELPLSL